MYLRNLILVAIVPMAAFAQNPVTADAPFQVKYAVTIPQIALTTTTGPDFSLSATDIDIANTGANGAALLGPGFGTQTGNICVNVYAFDPGEELISCCSCLITPDQTVHLTNLDLTLNTVTGQIPATMTVKLLSTLPGGSGASCTNSAATASTATLATGMAAWGTALHITPTACTAGASDVNCFATANIGSINVGTTETAFTPATLSTGELNSISGRCASILGNDSGFGICNSCRTGALGGSTLNQ